MTEIKNSSLALKQIIDHPHFKHFLLYSLSYIILGAVITCLGPMFPYLSEHQGRLQTEYSFLFVSRAAGFVLGSITMRIIGERLKLHQFIGLGISLMGVTCVLFGQLQSLYFKGFCIFIASIGSSFQDIAINMASLDCFKGKNLSGWLQVIHGCFGIGGLIGPFIVYIFELSSLTILGFIALITVVFYFKLETPQEMIDIKKIQQEDNRTLQLPQYSIYLISGAFLFAVGQQVSYGGWISSYAVLWNFSTKQHATFYSSLYWISITFFRFTMVLVPGKPSNKIKWLAIIGIITSFISYFIIFDINHQAGLVFMSILYGLCNSVLFPLLLTIPEQFGFQLTLKQSTLFIIWAALGQGCLAVGVGKMMQWFSYNCLLYSVGLFNIAIVLIVILNTNILIKFKNEVLQQGKLQNLINNQFTREQIYSKQNIYMQKDQNIEMKDIKR